MKIPCIFIPQTEQGCINQKQKFDVGFWNLGDVLAMVVPTISGIYGNFGYNEYLGKCDYITEDDNTPRTIFYSLGFGLPLILIVVSYFGIWITTIKSGLFLKPSSSVSLI